LKVFPWCPLTILPIFSAILCRSARLGRTSSCFCLWYKRGIADGVLAWEFFSLSREYGRKADSAFAGIERK